MSVGITIGGSETEKIKYWRKETIMDSDGQQRDRYKQQVMTNIVNVIVG